MILDLDRRTWKRVAFGDVIENVTERVDDPSKAGVDRYVGLEHLDPGVLTVQRWDSPDKVEAQKLRFYPGDVIFGRRRAYQKKVAMAEFEGICSAHALVLRAKPGLIEPDFLPVFLSSDYFLDRAIAISVGSLSPTVNWRDLKAETFGLPPLDGQKRIADLLWAGDRHKLAVQAEAMAMDHLINRLAENVIWSGDFPKKPLKELLVSCKYGTSERCVAEVSGPATPVLRIPNVLGGRLSLDDLKYLPEERTDDDPASVLDGDFLVVRTNGNPAYVARGALIPALDRTFLAASYLLRLRADQSQILPAFLAAAWETPTMKRALVPDIRSSAGNYNLSASSIMAHSLALPPLDEQRAIVQRLEELGSAANLIQAEVEALGLATAALSTEIFGGAA